MRFTRYFSFATSASSNYDIFTIMYDELVTKKTTKKRFELPSKEMLLRKNPANKPIIDGPIDLAANSRDPIWNPRYP